VPVIAAAVEESWRLRSAGAVGWPPTRWVRRLRPDPLRRLHLGSGDRREVKSMVRSSVPEATPVQKAQVETAVRRVVEAAGAGLPAVWQDAVRRAAGERSGDLRDELDATVVRVDLKADRTPLWWRVAGASQWLLVAAAVTGAGWLALLGFGSYLRLPDPPTPEWRGLAVPTVLLVGGVVVGLLLAFFGRLASGAGAVRRRHRAESRLRSGIAEVADRLVLAPVEAELARHDVARDAVDRARSG
jgi:hypothetical protein